MRIRVAAVVALFVMVTGMRAGLVTAAGPDPRGVYIESLTYGGSGCPNGTVGQSINDERTKFTLIFDQYIASTGPSTPVTESRKDCQVNLVLHVPNGAGNAFLNSDYRGYVQLPSGGSSGIAASYLTDGHGGPHRDMSFAGPVAQDYLHRDSVPVHQAGPGGGTCGGALVTLTIQSGIQLEPSTSPGQMTVDSIDGSISQTIKGKSKPGC